MRTLAGHLSKLAETQGRIFGVCMLECVVPARRALNLS